jgi:hypothetical protein
MRSFNLAPVLMVLAAVGGWCLLSSCARRERVASVPLGECRVDVFRRSGGATTGFRYELEAVASTGPEVRIGTLYDLAFLSVRVVDGRRLEVEYVQSGGSREVLDQHVKVCGFPTTYRELKSVPENRPNLAP